MNVSQGWRYDIDKLEGRERQLSEADYEAIRSCLNPCWDKLREYFQTHTPKTIPDIILNKDDLNYLMSARLIARHGHQIIPSFRLFKVRDVYISTDFPTKQKDRVFPWIDEGELMLNYIFDDLRLKPHKRVLNMCCGAGTIALVLAKKWANSTIVGVDNNNRAILLAQFNKQINKLPNLDFKHGELFDGLEEKYYDLIVAVPPFAIQPPGLEEYPHSAGGPYGEAVVEPLIKAVKQYLRPGGRFLMLCYSLGNEKEPLRILDLIGDNLCTKGDDPQQKCHHLDGKRVWRFRGKKRVDLNPMPVRYMAIRCGDQDYEIYDQEDGIEKYINWIEKKLIGHNPPYTHLHYLIVDYTAPKD